MLPSRWSRLLRDGVDVLVAERDPAAGVVGSPPSGPSRDAPSHEGHGELYALYADPGEWGSGTGRALHDAAVADLSDRGFADTGLWVLEGNRRARAFYARQGWRHDGAVRVESLSGARLPELRYRRPTTTSTGAT